MGGAGAFEWEMARLKGGWVAPSDLAATTRDADVARALCAQDAGYLLAYRLAGNRTLPRDVQEQITDRWSAVAGVALSNPNWDEDLALLAAENDTITHLERIAHLPASVLDHLTRTSKLKLVHPIPTSDTLALSQHGGALAGGNVSGAVRQWLRDRDAAAIKNLSFEHLVNLAGRGDLSDSEWLAAAARIRNGALHATWIETTPHSGRAAVQLIEAEIARHDARHLSPHIIVALLNLHDAETGRAIVELLADHDALLSPAPTLIQQTDLLSHSRDLVERVADQRLADRFLTEPDSRIDGVLARQHPPDVFVALTRAQQQLFANLAPKWKQSFGQLVRLAQTAS